MKTFILVCNVLLPVSLLVGLMLWIFRPQIEKEFTLAGGKVLMRILKDAMQPRPVASTPQEDSLKFPVRQMSFENDNIFGEYSAAATPICQPVVYQTTPVPVAEKVAVVKKTVTKKGKALGIQLRTPKLDPKTEEQIQTSVDAGIARLPFIIEHFGKIVEDTCSQKAIDPDLEFAKIAVESRGYINAVSDSGAMSLEQLMLKTGRHLLALRGIYVNDEEVLKVMLRDPYLNISLGTDHFLISMQLFNDPVKALVGYEAGDDHVLSQIRKFGGDVEVPYYRKIYGIYVWLKEHPELRQNRGLPIDLRMRAPREAIQMAEVR